MQDLDWAFKTALTLKPDCFLDLLFGSRRQTKLKEITDPQINVPELRADKALVIEDGGEICCLLFEAMLKPDRSELPTFALKALGMQYVLEKPVIAVIVYLQKGKYTTFPGSFENRIGKYLKSNNLKQNPVVGARGENLKRRAYRKGATRRAETRQALCAANHLGAKAWRACA
jgi:hypothetical protein